MKIETHQDNQKQAQILKMLQFGTIMIFVDSRHKDVLVPVHLKDDYQLRLNFDYAYELDDFRVLPDRIEASLSFNQQNFFCVIPFEAMYLLICHSIQHGVLFTESVPIEMLEYFAEEANAQEKKEALAAAKSFNVISGSGNLQQELSKDASPDAKKEKKKKRKKNHLRIVK